METTEKSTLFSDRLAWGITLLAIGMLIEVIVSVYGLTVLNVQFDPEMMAAPAFDPLQTAIGCLAPLTTLTRLVGVTLIILAGKQIIDRQIAGRQRKLAWGGLGLYILSLLIIVGVMVISISATTQGSLDLLLLANGLSAAAGVMAYVGLVLMVFTLAPSPLRLALLAALLLYAIGQGGVGLLTLGNTSLEAYELYGTTYYFPNMTVDRTTGLWPVLAVVSVAGQALFLVAFAALAVTGWRALGSALPDTVS